MEKLLALQEQAPEKNQRMNERKLWGYVDSLITSLARSAALAPPPVHTPPTPGRDCPASQLKAPESIQIHTFCSLFWPVGSMRWCNLWTMWLLVSTFSLMSHELFARTVGYFHIYHFMEFTYIWDGLFQLSDKISCDMGKPDAICTWIIWQDQSGGGLIDEQVTRIKPAKSGSTDRRRDKRCEKSATKRNKWLKDRGLFQNSWDIKFCEPHSKIEHPSLSSRNKGWRDWRRYDWEGMSDWWFRWWKGWYLIQELFTPTFIQLPAR